MQHQAGHLPSCFWDVSFIFNTLFFLISLGCYWRSIDSSGPVPHCHTLNYCHRAVVLHLQLLLHGPHPHHPGHLPHLYLSQWLSKLEQRQGRHYGHHGRNAGRPSRPVCRRTLPRWFRRGTLSDHFPLRAWAKSVCDAVGGGFPSAIAHTFHHEAAVLQVPTDGDAYAWSEGDRETSSGWTAIQDCYIRTPWL